MVVRRRVRMVVLPLGLWTLSALVCGYFIAQAESGNRGLEAKRALKIRAFGLNQELAAVKAERAIWEHRVGLLKSDQIDRDQPKTLGDALFDRPGISATTYAPGGASRPIVLLWRPVPSQRHWYAPPKP